MCRRDVVANLRGRVHIGLAHCHDLGLQAHFHAAKGHAIRRAFLPPKARKTGPCADMLQHGLNAIARAGNGAIHAFTRQQDRAPDALRLRQITQGLLPFGGVILTGKMVKGGDGDHGGVISAQPGLGKPVMIGYGWGVQPQGAVMQALIVIDVQNDFCPGGALAVAGGDAIIPLINGMMDQFAVCVLTQDWHPSGHASFAANHPGAAPFSTVQMPYGPQVLWPTHCVIGSGGAEFHPALRTDPAQMIIRKGFRAGIDSYSAFFENDRTTPTGLEGYLRSRGVTALVMVGLATDYCVTYSALDACRLGFQVTVNLDACRAIDLQGSGAQALASMQQAGVQFKSQL
jgi:nicotinamidase/pyrazinamidase